LFLASPLHDVVGVHGEAEEVGWNKARLRSFHPDVADDEAICACHEPAVPHAASNQNGGADRKDTRKVIETKHAQFHHPATLDFSVLAECRICQSGVPE
jgi:hypothetical protein